MSLISVINEVIPYLRTLSLSTLKLILIVKYNILYENQFGFQQYKSTSDATLKFTDFCSSAINNQEVTLFVFLNFSKAFDTIVHHILLKKLELYGIRGHMNSWFKSYLSNRKEYFEINECRSPDSQIKLGVP